MSIRKKIFFLIFTISAMPLILIRYYPKENITSDYSFSKMVFDRNAKLLRMTITQDDQFRIKTKLFEFPEKTINSILMKEDRYFYYRGVAGVWFE